MDQPTDISAYKPNPSVIAAFEFDENLPDGELSFDVFKKLVLARKTQDVVFLAIGKMLKVFRDRQLYKSLDFETFEQFLASEEISFSREKAYMMMRIYEFYVEVLELSEDVIKDFPVVRLSMMLPILKKMPTKEEQIKELERVKSLRHSDFIRELKEAVNTEGKPSVYWSEEANGRWVVNYYEKITVLKIEGEEVKTD
jgi:hypothetical protein